MTRSLQLRSSETPSDGNEQEVLSFRNFDSYVLGWEFSYTGKITGRIGYNFLPENVATVTQRPRKQLSTTKVCLYFETPPWYCACWERREAFVLRP